MAFARHLGPIGEECRALNRQRRPPEGCRDRPGSFAMRTTMFALALLVAGCSTTPKVPAPSAARDGKTPVALEKSSISHRIVDRRMQDAQVARGKLAVEGQLVR